MKIKLSNLASLHDPSVAFAYVPVVQLGARRRRRASAVAPPGDREVVGIGKSAAIEIQAVRCGNACVMGVDGPTAE